jgi:DNA-binding NarL/FixJ family response regulator
MPGKDGIELLGLIRADERLVRVPVILLTAKAMTQDRVAGYRAGADVYLSKPFDPNELLSIIDNAIQRRRQMSGTNGNLLDLKQDMENIKQIMRKNSDSVVKKTDVYLTDSERDTLELICKGYANAEIASERGVHVMTINRAIQKIYMDTGTRTRTELVRWAISTGYVPARTN